MLNKNKMLLHKSLHDQPFFFSVLEKKSLLLTSKDLQSWTKRFGTVDLFCLALRKISTINKITCQLVNVLISKFCNIERRRGGRIVAVLFKPKLMKCPKQFVQDCS